jgi:hypothetical protein
MIELVPALTGALDAAALLVAAVCPNSLPLVAAVSAGLYRWREAPEAKR